MEMDIFKLIGLLLAVVAAVLTTIRMSNNRLGEFKAEVTADIKELHSRISSVKEDYVRRDDNDKRYEQIEKLLDGLATKMDKLIQRK